MATHRIPIIGWSVAPDTSGSVFPEGYDVKASNDQWDRNVMVFNDTATRIGFAGGFTVPKNYVGSANLIVVWTSTATTNNCVWDFEYRAVGGNDAESLDQAGTQGSVTGTDAAPGAAHRRLELTIDLTDSDLAADDEVEYGFFRDGADAADTMAAAALLFELLFEYVDA